MSTPWQACISIAECSHDTTTIPSIAGVTYALLHGLERVNVALLPLLRCARLFLEGSDLFFTLCFV